MSIPDVIYKCATGGAYWFDGVEPSEHDKRAPYMNGKYLSMVDVYCLVKYFNVPVIEVRP